MPGIIGKTGAERSRAWIWDFVRHEALHYRAEMEGLRRSSPDNEGDGSVLPDGPGPPSEMERCT
jgi:hypothetical protein